MGQIFCTECGKPNSDESVFCTACGARLAKLQPTQAMPVVAPAQPAYQAQPAYGYQQTPYAAPRPAKRSNGPIIALVAVIVVAVIAIAAILLFNPFGANRGAQSESAAPAAVSSQAAPASSSAAAAQSSAAAAVVAPSSSAAAPAREPDYVIPDSGSRYYSRSELEKYSNLELYHARNEIYARYGRGFKNQDLRDYFASKDWYVERYTPEQFDSMASPLNDYERKNADLMLEIEKARNSPYL